MTNDEVFKVGIDADLIVYKACCQKTEYDAIVGGKIHETFTSAADYKRWWEQLPPKMQDNTTREAVIIDKPLEEAIDICDMWMYRIRNALNASSMHPFLTSNDKSNFRYKLATLKEYKEQRKEKEKPIWFAEIQQHLVDRWGAIVVHGYEADDALAEFQDIHWRRLMRGKFYDSTDVTCIASLDKDLLMVPGYHYNFDNRKLSYVTQEQGYRSFYLQLLTGDMGTDNIPGLFQMTKKMCTAKIKKGLDDLHTEQEMYDYVWTTWVGATGKLDVYERYLKEIGNLLYMRRYEGDEWSKPKSWNKANSNQK